MTVYDDQHFQSTCPGQLKWISDTKLVGVATNPDPRRLGIVYCSNRPSVVFELSLEDERYFASIKSVFLYLVLFIDKYKVNLDRAL